MNQSFKGFNDVSLTPKEIEQRQQQLDKLRNQTDYRKEVVRLWNDKNTHKDTLISSGFGLTEEAGEYVSLLKKHMFHGHELDKTKVLKELGDVRYYLEIAAWAHGLTMEEIEQANLDKLNKRYPGGFSEEKSINRKE